MNLLLTKFNKNAVSSKIQAKLLKYLDNDVVFYGNCYFIEWLFYYM
jgi:hypothetical protein